MKVELPNINDYEKINELAVMLHDLHVSWRPDIFVHTDEIFSQDELDKMIMEKTIYVAKEGSAVLGYVILGPIKEGEKKGYKYRKILNIDALVVDEKARNKGVDTLLFNFVKEYAKSLKCTGINLTVNEENICARNLYEKMGMRVKNVAYLLDLND